MFLSSLMLSFFVLEFRLCRHLPSRSRWAMSRQKKCCKMPKSVTLKPTRLARNWPTTMLIISTWKWWENLSKKASFTEWENMLDKGNFVPRTSETWRLERLLLHWRPYFSINIESKTLNFDPVLVPLVTMFHPNGAWNSCCIFFHLGNVFLRNL